MIITAINNNDNDNNNDDDDDDNNNNNNNNNSKVFSLINVICRVMHMDNFSLCYKLVNLSSIPVVFALSCMCFFTVCKVMEKKKISCVPYAVARAITVWVHHFLFKINIPPPILPPPLAFRLAKVLIRHIRKNGRLLNSVALDYLQ